MTRYRPSWHPWRELSQLQDEVNRLFSPSRSLPFLRRAEFPAVNIWQNEHGLVLTAEVPGYDADSLDVTVTGDSVTIRSEGRNGELQEGESYRRHERVREPFSRTVELPTEIDPQQTEASYDRGVLTLKLSRPEAQRPKKIQIKAG